MNNHVNNHKNWFPYALTNPASYLRLFCLPHAGGASVLFHPWTTFLPPSIELYPVELPGHGARGHEQALSRMRRLTQAIAEGMYPHLDKPFALFGHSMGALVCFELARLLRRAYDVSPRCLFVSAHRAPQLPDPDPTTYMLSEEDLVRKLQTLEGTPKEILEQPDLLRMVLPNLRADFAVCDTYTYRAEAPLDCPIIALGGDSDPEISREQLEGWHEQTSRVFQVHTFPGGHFYINTSRPAVLKLMTETMEQML
ncbi:MAG: thioesterase [Chloroflexaceae bacterium]|nr:thioesterase [Chloroflexaceae bacterium]